MTVYFKTAFKPYFEKWKVEKKRPSISVYLAEFAYDYFPELL